MSVAEKYATLIEKIPQIHEAGKQELVKLHPEVTVSGSYISLDDVSELPHEVKCKVSGVDDPTSVTVTRCGTNLLNPDKLEKGELVEYNGVQCYKFRDNADNFKYYGSFLPNTQYTFSFKVYAEDKNTTVGISCVLYYVDGSADKILAFHNGTYTLVTDANKTVSHITGVYNSNRVLYIDLEYTRLSLGTTALPYEPYNGQALTPNEDGTIEGMTSVSPYMNIFTDTEGANLEVTYRKSLGIQTEYDRFWDEFQKNGTRTTYLGAFGSCWNKEIFKPKYKIKFGSTANGAYGAFMYFGYGSSENTDFREIAHFIDWSTLSGNVSTMFQDARIDFIDIDFSNCTLFVNTFSEGWSAGRKTTISLKVSEKATSYSGAFGYCSALTDLTFKEGSVIAASIDLRYSPLTKASITSVINALSDTVAQKTLTLKLSAVNTAFETSTDAADGSTSEEFAALVATKTNWTITMI